MPTIIDCIETAGPDRRARRLVFSDTLEPRVTSGAVVRVLGLQEGTEVDPTELTSLLDEVELSQARERALRLLGYRERSVKELAKRLTDDGYPAAVAQAVTDRMSETGLVDDDRFAMAWARSRAAAGFGPKRVLRELAMKGVDPELSSAAVSAAYEGQEPVARARELLGSADTSTRAGRDRAIRKLLRRGYDIGIALKAVDDSERHDR